MNRASGHHDELARTQSPDLCPESHVKFAGENDEPFVNLWWT